MSASSLRSAVRARLLIEAATLREYLASTEPQADALAEIAAKRVAVWSSALAGVADLSDEDLARGESMRQAQLARQRERAVEVEAMMREVKSAKKAPAAE